MGIAGGTVSDWRNYDSMYTERYMGLFDEARYRAASALEGLGRIQARLLLIHGMIDENVHFRHTGRLLDALIRHRKPHELLLFPNERHMPRGEADRTYLEERVRDFFLDALRVR